jgi:hypothetical protein
VATLPLRLSQRREAGSIVGPTRRHWPGMPRGSRTSAARHAATRRAWQKVSEENVPPAFRAASKLGRVISGFGKVVASGIDNN